MDYRSCILADNPVNYWRLGESSGDVLDEMGEHDLIWSGTPTYGAAGALVNDANAAVLLNGSAHAKKSISNYRAEDQQGTIEAWVKSTQTSSTYIFSCGNVTEDYSAFVVNVDTEGKVFIYHNDGTGVHVNASAGASVKDGQWHFLHVVSTGDEYRVFIDAIEHEITVLTGTNDGRWFGDDAIWDNVCIGAAFAKNGAYNQFVGAIDELAVYDYPLTHAQILIHYGAGLDTLKRLSGTVANRFGQPCQRKVYAISRPTDTTAPQILAHTLSDPTTGAYDLILLTEDEVTRIVVSEDDDPILNDLVDRVIPA
jgi:hypothetical protein